MSRVLLAMGAQLGAEVRTRLRSAGTLVALAFILVGSTLWMPDPRGKAASLTWRLAGEAVNTPMYRSPYVGAATAILTAVFFVLVAFYLVAGSVRRDRETGVGAILAATPLGKGAYLAGKVAANTAYLGLIAAMILAVGVGKFLAFGEGPFEPARFLLPWLLVSVPAMLFVAAMAVLFDVTPGLRSRSGLVIWFFVSMFLFTALPLALGDGPDASGLPAFDPIGLATLHVLVKGSLPPEAREVSIGLIFRDGPLTRVPWAGIEIPWAAAAGRAASALLAVLPFLLSVALFDRFDPARRLAWRVLRRPPASPPAAENASAPDGGGRTATAAFRIQELPAIDANPGARAAFLAEARLIWESSPLLRWALLAAGVAGGALPGESASFAAAAFLLILVPVISEAGAREALAGSEALVFSQPSVPLSGALWKTGSLALFLLAVSAPLLFRAALSSPARLIALVTGLLFVSAFASCSAFLTRGGKLFSGLYLALWYAAVNRLAAADFCGVLGGGLEPAVRSGYLAAGAAFLGLAMLVERRRRLTGR